MVFIISLWFVPRGYTYDILKLKLDGNESVQEGLYVQYDLELH